MANAKFILKEPKSKEETLIYMLFRYQYKRFKYSTGEKILPKFWNEDKQRVKKTKQFPQYPEFNTRLTNFETANNIVFRRLLNDGIQPDNKMLKQALEAELSGNILQPRKITILDFVEKYIEESKLHKKERTVKVYKTTQKYLKSYSEKLKKDLDFDSIDLEFYNQYTAYLSVENNLSANTVGKHIKTIKSFLNEATDRGHNINLDFKKRKFKTIREDSDSIYLSVIELKKFENLDLSASPPLEKSGMCF